MAWTVFLLRVLLFTALSLMVEGCLRDSDCDKDQHCCRLHCTTIKIQCSHLCSRDEECPKDFLCSQQICVACSKRYNCELKSCFNDSNCPDQFYCGKNHMCTKSDPKKQSFSILPFVIIVAVFGFALVVLCYTEGCWKEFFLYIKRRTGRYGTIALDECEADRRDENESGINIHRNKSCVDTQSTSRNIENTSTSQQIPSHLPQPLRNTHIISHNSRTLVMAIARATEIQSSSPSSSPAVTRDAQRSCNNSGIQPLLCNGQANSGSTESLPSYVSLFNQQFEEPPPKYEDVVHFPPGPISIEMVSISHNRTSRERQIETVV